MEPTPKELTDWKKLTGRFEQIVHDGGTLREDEIAYGMQLAQYIKALVEGDEELSTELEEIAGHLTQAGFFKVEVIPSSYYLTG